MMARSVDGLIMNSAGDVPLALRAKEKLPKSELPVVKEVEMDTRLGKWSLTRNVFWEAFWYLTAENETF
jgi:hypothetical protein